MRKKKTAVLAILLLVCSLYAGCGTSKEPVQETDIPQSSQELATNSDESQQEMVSQPVLEDGEYLADFDTDSSMFHVSEACDGKGTLYVTEGKMMIHVSLQSEKILNLYYGLAEDAQKEGAELLSPSVDVVTFSDGLSEEVYGFDIPVPALDQEFDVALVGTKGKWYDHKVVVSNPVKVSETANSEGVAAALEDGNYTIEHTFAGGSGKAQIASPATLHVENGIMVATLCWNSPNYDYMIVDGEKYLPVNESGDSVFEIPISGLDTEIIMIGDTVAMSKPHEIEYTLTFHSETVQTVE